MLWIFYAYIKTGEILLITINAFGCFIETVYLVIYITYCPRKARVRMNILLNLSLWHLLCLCHNFFLYIYVWLIREYVGLAVFYLQDDFLVQRWSHFLGCSSHSRSSKRTNSTYWASWVDLCSSFYQCFCSTFEHHCEYIYRMSQKL